jgi:Ser-tRNA(Ala) deacylase AlaX
MKREDALKLPHLAKLAQGLPEGDELRILRIGDIDEQADGGTHVSHAKEIRGIRLLSIENKGKNNRRVYYTVECERQAETLRLSSLRLNAHKLPGASFFFSEMQK